MLGRGEDTTKKSQTTVATEPSVKQASEMQGTSMEGKDEARNIIQDDKARQDEVVKIYSVGQWERLVESVKRNEYKPTLIDLESAKRKDVFLSLGQLVPLLKALQANISVQSLNLSWLPITDAILPSLIHLFRVNKTIICLNLSKTAITSDGISILFKALNSVRSVRLISDHADRCIPPQLIEPEQKKDEIADFDVDCDDSSADEEEIEHKVGQYNVAIKWAEWAAEHKGSEETDEPFEDDELLSFVTHAAGIRCFYSPRVQSCYKALKLIHLRQKNAAIKLCSRVHVSIITVVRQALSSAASYGMDFFSVAERENFNRKQEIFLIEFGSALEVEIRSNLINIIQWFKDYGKAKEPDKGAVNALRDKIASLIMQYFKKHFCQGNVVQRDIRANLLQITNQITEKFLSQLPSSVKDKKNRAGWDAAQNEWLSIRASYTRLLKVITDEWINVKASGYVKTMLGHFRKSLRMPHSQELLFLGFVEDIKHAQSNGQSLETIANVGLVKSYILHSDTLLESLIKEFVTLYDINFRMWMCKFPRVTLNKSHLFVSINPFSFFANLRLSNRSQKRKIKNFSYAKFGYDCAYRLWGFGDTEASRSVLETQKILSGSLGREDEVLMGLRWETYAEIYKVTREIPELFAAYNIKISGKETALWIRNIFQGVKQIFTIAAIDQIDEIHREEILDKLRSITYLLFGCEAVRNPAMHVVNQMLLDLIIEGEVTWEEALVGTMQGEEQKHPKRMPMSPKGATAAARKVEDGLRAFMPNGYLYKGTPRETELTSEQLQKLEARIVRHWLRLRKFDVFAEQDVRFPRDGFAFWLLEKIEGCFDEWFGPSPTSIGSGLSSSSSFPSSSSSSRSPSVPADTHWYNSDEMNKLLHHYLNDPEHIEIIVPIDAFQGTTLTENLYDSVIQQVCKISRGAPGVHTIVIPVNLGELHWCSCYIHFTSQDRTTPRIWYIDSFQRQLPAQVKKALLGVFAGVHPQTIQEAPYRLQDDGHNCGPWAIEVLKKLVATEGREMPLPNFDIVASRAEHMRDYAIIRAADAENVIAVTSTSKQKDEHSNQLI